MKVCCIRHEFVGGWNLLKLSCDPGRKLPSSEARVTQPSDEATMEEEIVQGARAFQLGSHGFVGNVAHWFPLLLATGQGGAGSSREV